MTHEHGRHSDDSDLHQWMKSAIDAHEHALVRYAQQFVGDAERGSGRCSGYVREATAVRPDARPSSRHESPEVAI